MVHGSKERFAKLKRSVASALHLGAGGRSSRPEADVRPQASRGDDSNVGSELVALAWPITIAMLGDTAMGLVDTKLVASLGPAPLGGVGVATTVMWLCYCVVFGFMRGVKVRTAFAVGEGRPDDAIAYARAGLVLGAVLGVCILLAARDATWAFVGLGVDPATVPYARDFLAARTLGAPAICMVSALVQYRQGLSDTRTPMIAGLSANIINAVLAWALIHGHFGLPKLGVAGAGYGTAIAEVFEVAFLLYVVSRERRESTLSLRAATREVAQLGVPTGAQFGCELLAFTAFTAILSGISAHEIAAHQIAMSIIRTSFLPGVAIAEAASVLVGRELGARRLDRADSVTRHAVVLAVAFMSACGVLFALAGGAFVRAFTEDAGVVRIATRLLLVAAVFQTLDAVAIVLRGALRGAKDVRWVAVIGISVAWGSIPTAAYFLGKRLGMGAVGGWYGFIAETTVASALFLYRWRRGAWRDDYAVAKKEEPVAAEALAAA